MELDQAIFLVFSSLLMVAALDRFGNLIKDLFFNKVDRR